MDGLSRHIAVCACAAKVETRDEVVWARCNAGEVFLEVITFLSHINSNRRLRFEGCDLSFSAHHEVLLNVPNASTLSKFVTRGLLEHNASAVRSVASERARSNVGHCATVACLPTLISQRQDLECPETLLSAGHTVRDFYLRNVPCVTSTEERLD